MIKISYQSWVVQWGHSVLATIALLETRIVVVCWHDVTTSTLLKVTIQ